ncbi:MAG TPA: CRISPR-associated helicase Cas3' [Thermosynechococcus sp. M3746_W2019_013]|uniref:CRISPR-associated helicase Cas3' n=1 Tax=Thermosynechococcus sp. M3746_W2019_013 TaxID=2747806 RepID=UPI0019FC70F7|nr:CRISPR-associated helicase Cas3' [Thermosynechococcus sp. M3746_W2019_013]HIK23218.1 CRISPR-associated helicase Cas3' [Thermosynechococcus sp. M3746_W2019_013]
MPPRFTPPKLEPDILLAKSSLPGNPDWGEDHDLVGHTAAVVKSITTLVHSLGSNLLQQFGLGDRHSSFATLEATARLAAYLHDWGKANHQFQGVVRYSLIGSNPSVSPQRNPLERPQLIRHEVGSVLLAWEFREWLVQCPNADFMTAIAAAGGHHLKLGGKDGKDTGKLVEVREGSGDTCLHWYVKHPYFCKLIHYGVRTLGLPQDPPLSQFSQQWEIKTIKDKGEKVLDAFIDEWEPDAAFVAVVKALLVAADAIASASGQMAISLQQWIEDVLKQTLTEADLQTVINTRLCGHSLRPFQTDLANTPQRVTLARAGCGSGKTLGAYCWAQKHAIGRKLFFCYPTTGTSTEGFLGYVHNKVESELLHSRSAVDLELACTGEEVNNGDGSVNETAQKLEAFKAWDAKVNICTVDTVLGLLQCHRRPLYCFPAIANAAFVFDEVHCYDEALFGALLRFLKVVKAPILLMSASFLPTQVEAIKEAVGEPVEVVQGPQELEDLPRYRFHQLTEPDWEWVQQELAKGGKVLWVCNQVDTAIAVYQQAKARGLRPLLYHSRFRYGDRVDRHRAVVDAFKQDQPILAITTQVAEMSLDLSATLLVSQIADPAGLIQRLGRLNRQYCGHPRDALFYPDEKTGFPYSQDQLKAGEALIQKFAAQEVSQRQLAAWLENLNIQHTPKDHFVWLDGKWKTYPAPLRKAGYTVTALLEQDQPTVAQLKWSELARYTVPLPANNIQGWQRHRRGYLIAPQEQWGYDSELGAFALK